MRPMRLVWMALLCSAVSIGVWVLATLPPSPAVLSVTVPPTTAFGAYHIHTDRSDGSGTIDDVAAAAARAGLQFVIVTDHGDATRTPDPPVYRHGVLVIDAVEISVREGHLVALGLRDGAPYPLGGEARDVVEDVARMGGWSVAAHPDSPKAELRWTGRATDGIEWINADSEWRDEAPTRILRAVAHSMVRPEGAIAGLFGRPGATFRRWDNWARNAPVIGLAAVDAHARISVDDQDEPRNSRTLLARPSYEDMFRTLVQAVWLDTPLVGTPADDATRVLAALRRGRSYSAVTAIARPAVLLVDTSPHRLQAWVEGAPDAEVRLLHRGREVAAGRGRVETATLDPGLYRVEVHWPGVTVPWIVSAPVFRDAPVASPVDPSPLTTGPALTVAADGPWTVEHHPACTAAWTRDGLATVLTYSLAAGRAASQYAALVHPLDSSRSFEEIRLTISADRPTRLSVQVRMAGPADGERWVRSVYADTVPREVRVRLEDLEPAERGITRRPIAARLQSLLFVVDGPNTPPGSRGEIRVSNIRLHAPPPAAEVMSGR